MRSLSGIMKKMLETLTPSTPTGLSAEPRALKGEVISSQGVCNRWDGFQTTDRKIVV